jgi:hypothetical protein
MHSIYRVFKSHETHGEMQYTFYFFTIMPFSYIISAENVCHYAFHTDEHNELC